MYSRVNLHVAYDKLFNSRGGASDRIDAVLVHVKTLFLHASLTTNITINPVSDNSGNKYTFIADNYETNSANLK